MNFKKYRGIILAGFCAGAVNGLFGAGGGMVLVPLMSLLTPLQDEEIFSSSIAIILPICLVTLTVTALSTGVEWSSSLPYLLGSLGGGFLAGIFGKKIPVVWLHRGLGLLIIYGGVRYLC